MRLDSTSFVQHINQLQLFHRDELLLVAVSGGVDSMVLVHLLWRSGYRFHIAHVNFGLRGNESDDDERFVIEYAQQHHISYHVHRASPHDFKQDKTSIQEDARRLRYRWLHELKQEIGAGAIVLAHHMDDQSETILHQFLRGGMLAALRGMHARQDDLVRPLLAFSKKEILAYAHKHRVAWREDSSNHTTVYTRNYLRHEVIPALQKVNPDIQSSLAERASIFAEIEQLVDQTTQGLLNKMIQRSPGSESIRTDDVAQSPYRQLLLWKWLSPVGFSAAQIQEVLNILSAQSGAYVENSTHRVLKDRGALILYSKPHGQVADELIADLPFSVSHISIAFSTREEVRFNQRHVQFMDAAKIKFPLTLRVWKEGDKWQPLGLRGTQKISDLLVGQKVSLADKPNVRLLQDADGTIIATRWRISERAKLEENSEQILRVEWLLGGDDETR